MESPESQSQMYALYFKENKTTLESPDKQR